MRGTKAKKIRREIQNNGGSTKTKKYFRVRSTGQIVADTGRRMYQGAKGRAS